MDIISSKEIESTKAFKNINKSLQSVYLKRTNRAIIDNALIVFRNTGVLNAGIGTRMTLIVKELIKIESKNDETKKKT